MKLLFPTQMCARLSIRCERLVENVHKLYMNCFAVSRILWWFEWSILVLPFHLFSPYSFVPLFTHITVNCSIDWCFVSYFVFSPKLWLPLTRGFRTTFAGMKAIFMCACCWWSKKDCIQLLCTCPIYIIYNTAVIHVDFWQYSLHYLLFNTKK